MQIFLSAFEDVPDPRARNARHDLGEVRVIAFVSVLCGASSCAEMAAFGRAKELLFRDFLTLKHAIPSHDTFSDIFRMIDPKALDAAFGKVLADVAALLKDGDVIAIDGKAMDDMTIIDAMHAHTVIATATTRVGDDTGCAEECLDPIIIDMDAFRRRRNSGSTACRSVAMALSRRPGGRGSPRSW